LLAGIRLVEALGAACRPLSEMSNLVTIFPQVLFNVPVSVKPDIDTIAEIRHAVASVEKALGERGRVLVRYSGTQPLCRVMVEGPTLKETTRYCKYLSDVIRKHIGRNGAHAR
jgi:phosphoglucosamine mutase